MIIGDIFIETIGSALGSINVSNIEQAARYGKDEDFVRNRVGPLLLPHRAEGETACSLALEAAANALDASRIEAEDLELVVFVTQNPDHGGLPHNSAILHGRLGLAKSVACFDVGLGCSGYVYGLAITASLMKTGSMKSAMLVTSDHYTPFLKPDDQNTKLLFGDGAAATILSRQGAFEIRAAAMGTDGGNHDKLIRREDGIEMNGRAIFNFSRQTVPESIITFCNANDLALDSFDALLLHQGSRAVVEEIAKHLNVNSNIIPVEIGDTGNTVSSSIPLLLEKRMTDRAIRRLLLTGFGVGLSWGNVWLERG